VANYQGGSLPAPPSEIHVAGHARCSTYRRQRLQGAHAAIPRNGFAEQVHEDELQATERCVAGVCLDRADTDERSSATPSAVRARGEGVDPRHVFLDAKAIMQRYGWGKTKGYQNLKNRSLVPPPVMTHPDRWRLDQLLAWEDRRIAAAAVDQVGPPPNRSLKRLESRLPAPKRVRRTSA